MNIQHDVNLKPYHTFGVDAQAQALIEINDIDEIKTAFQLESFQGLPKLILGKGSNVLFTEDFQGLVLVNRLQGKTVTQTADHYHLHIAGGEDWPSLVEWSLSQGMGGLENLGLIPGCAGSAPIQNIGAYGVEFNDRCEYVEFINLDDFSQHRLGAEQCQFGYRDSIFKHALLGKVMITAIGLKLPKQWQPNLSYGPLKAKEEQLTTPKAVFDLVCEIRREKLPDPSQIGNAGSFFKNPVISNSLFEQIKAQHPELNGFASGDGIKIAAGWLIDQCGLKGYSVGGAQVHPKQALVLINQHNATAQDVLDLAWHVKQTVLEKFSVELFHEVRFLAGSQETNLERIKAK